MNACPICGAEVQCQIVPVPHEDYEDERWSCIACEWWSKEKPMPVTPLASIGDDPRLEQRPARRAKRAVDETTCSACGGWSLDADYCACGCGQTLDKDCGLSCEACGERLMPECALMWDECQWCPKCLADAKRIAGEEAEELRLAS